MLVAPEIVLCSSADRLSIVLISALTFPAHRRVKPFEFASFSANEKQTPKSRVAQIAVGLWGGKT